VETDPIQLVRRDGGSEALHRLPDYGQVLPESPLDIGPCGTDQRRTILVQRPQAPLPFANRHVATEQADRPRLCPAALTGTVALRVLVAFLVL